MLVPKEKRTVPYKYLTPKISEPAAWPEWYFQFKWVTLIKWSFLYREHYVRIGTQHFYRTAVNVTSISIITATYNAEKTIKQCLESVSSQSVSVEHVIIDGGSTDETIKIAHEHRNGLASIASAADQGIYDAMNKGIGVVTGDIVGILNADDYYPANNVLEKVCEQFTDAAIGACYGDLLYVDTKKNKEKIVRTWRAGKYNPDRFYWGWMPPHPTFFVRREHYEQFGRFNLDLGSAADYELMLRFLLKNNVSAKYIPEVLVHMRVGGVSNVSIANRIAANRMDKKAWSVNDLQPYPWTFLAKPLRKISQWLW